MPGAYAFVHFKLLPQEKSATDSLSIPSNVLLFRPEGLRVGVVCKGKTLPAEIRQDLVD
jgi:hypothetical protein